MLRRCYFRRLPAHLFRIQINYDICRDPFNPIRNIVKQYYDMYFIVKPRLGKVAESSRPQSDDVPFIGYV